MYRIVSCAHLRYAAELTRLFGTLFDPPPSPIRSARSENLLPSAVIMSLNFVAASPFHGPSGPARAAVWS
ncbi:hypothetical protein CU254_25190 [Amycolatopsis sp. AA4]|nr:hypothetical protein CU254_25190 [Amycolatopsis sp. AA4]